ncbi:helix-turn-helix domain-containing protein [Lactobacillus helveticus]|uniref:Helix-turn-helix domain-containing protein n=1 Tax=Lactobacillus helveticus TaxID=1587 RepID=A0A6A7K3U8_LACHE|nr:helix-turn-helix transcriptional regulator [Lactobacillus helveticus]MPW15307.1 helix-turn-helix domain-containing protein [Lactobacillus helveticus]
MTIGEVLKEEREQLKLTQKKMVEGTAISFSHYSKIENGIQDIKAKDLFALLDARKIDIYTFKEKVDNQRNENLDELTDKLTKAFYKPDIELAKQVKEKIDDFSNAEELQIRAELVVAVLTHNLKETKQELNSKLVNYFERDATWMNDPDMLRIIGNSTRITDFNLLATLMDKLLVKYDDINKFSLDTQKRIGNIFINYLHVLYDNRAKRMVQKYIKFLKKLPGIPELILNKLMGDYYDALFSKNKEELAWILHVLKRAVPKIVEGLPEK